VEAELDSPPKVRLSTKDVQDHVRPPRITSRWAFIAVLAFLWRMKVDINWAQMLEDILHEQASCPRCGILGPQFLAGYSREPWAAFVAPRCHDCKDKDDCDSRKLVFLCEKCATELRLRARPVDQVGMMILMMQDCRDDISESLEFVREYWQEEFDIEPEYLDSRLEDFAPDVFEEENAYRADLEDEYLTYHRWFRARGNRKASSN